MRILFFDYDLLLRFLHGQAFFVVFFYFFNSFLRCIFFSISKEMYAQNFLCDNPTFRIFMKEGGERMVFTEAHLGPIKK